MYILIKKTNGNSEPVACSNNLQALRKRLVREAKLHLKTLKGTDNPELRRYYKEKITSINSQANPDKWSCTTSGQLVLLHITRIPFLKETTPQVNCVMAFGTELVDKIDEGDTDIQELIDEYDNDELLVIRRFRTNAEKQAYFRGVQDNYGYEAYACVNELDPKLAKKFLKLHSKNK